MTIASEITRIKNNIASAYTILSDKGATLPAAQNSANLTTTVDSVPLGIITATNSTGAAISSGDKVWVNYKEFTGQNQGATISPNFIASGFGQYNYVKYIEHFDFSKPWEFKCKVFRNDYDYGQDRNAFIYTSVESSSESFYSAGFGLFLGLGFNFYFRVNGTNQGIGGGTVNVNTTYWIKCGWTGTEYYLDYSTDGETYTSIGTFQSTSSVTQTNDNIDIGSSVYVSGFYWKGTIDLKELSMTIDNTVVWKGLSDVSPKLVGYENSNYFSDTGIAKENIAIDATGNVAVID